MATRTISAERRFNKPTLIYGLVDPRDNQLRYIGQTASSLERRFSVAWSRARNEGRKTGVISWLSGMAAEGMRPEIILIETVPDRDRHEAEQFWIAYFRAIGADLCNIAVGGPGRLGEKHSPEEVEKRTAWMRTPQCRAFRSSVSRQIWTRDREAIIAAQNAGKDAAWRRKQGESKRQQWADPNSPLHAANRAKRKLSDADVANIRLLLGQGVKNKLIAEQYGIAQSLVSHIKAGRKRQ